MAKRNLHTHPFQYVTQVSQVIVLGFIVLSCIFTINHFQASRTFPIKTVRVYGINHVDKQEVQDLLIPLVAHGFFNANVDYIRDRLLQIPWVSDIFVRRDWPDQIAITLIEKKAIARWNDESLLSEGGEFFSPNTATYPTNLPLFKGSSGQQKVMLQYFRDMNRLLTPLHAKISYLELTPFYTWRARLDNGLALELGHKDILLRLQHFVKVYRKIVGNRAEDVVYIDLRYPNGVAVQWKT